MALKRVWTPSGNYSGGGTKRLLVIHSMEGFTGPNGAYDCAKYFQGDNGASSQVCIDNNRGTIWECVSRTYGSWTQCSYNSVSISAEQSGYGSWSRDYWLNNRNNQLQNVAEWLAEESAKTGIPLNDLSASQAQSGGRGVVYHSELGYDGCNHSDPGAGWPIDVVLQMARGETKPIVEDAFYMTAASARDSHGFLHLVCIGSKDGRVYYKREDAADFYAVDPTQGPVKSGADINIGNDKNGVETIDLLYVAGSGGVGGYHKAVDSGEFGWRGWGGSAK
jgi:hypothetical protein